MTNRTTHADRCCDILKLLRDAAYTNTGIAAELGADTGSVRYWTQRLKEHGLLVSGVAVRERATGVVGIGYRVAPAWRGQP